MSVTAASIDEPGVQCGYTSSAEGSRPAIRREPCHHYGPAAEGPKRDDDGENEGDEENDDKEDEEPTVIREPDEC